MNSDDFLWECAFQSQGKDRLWIIPDRDDLFVQQRDGLLSEQRILETMYLIPRGTSTSNSNVMNIRIVEQRGQGVCDVIGGEVWEAALLLSAFLLMTFWSERNNVSKPIRFLELGSGVGLPSLLLARLQQQLNDYRDDDLSSCPLWIQTIAMTDFDPQLVGNLIKAVQIQLPVSSDNEPIVGFHGDDQCLTTKLCVGTLDWEIFSTSKDKASNEFVNVYIEESDDDFMNDSVESESNDVISGNEKLSILDINAIEQRIPKTLHNDQFDILIGSALCYAPYHSNCLASLVDYYLQPESSVKEVVIIQIHDREGFHAFLSRLDDMSHVKYELEEINDELYEYASSFYRSLGNESFNNPDHHYHRSLQSLGEEEVGTFVYDYYFPLFQNPQSHGLELPMQDRQKFKFNLIQTDRSSFKLLRIFKDDR